jgi:hypothetical protein
VAAASPKAALADRSNTSDALALLEAGKPPVALSPGTLIRQVREVTGHTPLAAAPKEGADDGGGVDTEVEIGDIDRRLNQLQEFLRQAKEGQVT